MPSENNKRIAKNTLVLYLRMFFMMPVQLYTSRVVLHASGFIDYGIYNVVGGVIILFSFINNAMATATQRFLTFELGKNDIEHLKKVFNTSIYIYAHYQSPLYFRRDHWVVVPKHSDGLSIGICTVAVNWVYQFSIFSCMVMVLSVPYSAVIIAHEK